jgi:hypothetical protein
VITLRRFIGGVFEKILFEKPSFTNVDCDGKKGMYDDGQVRKVIDIVDAINRNAEVG